MKALPAVLFVTAMLAGCAGYVDNTDDLPVVPDPRLEASYPDVLPLKPSGLVGLSRLATPDGDPWPTGGGNWVQGNYVYGSALDEGFYIADISDPENPVLVYQSPEDTETAHARKAEVVTHADGRLTLALATQWDGMHLWNVTDPYHPEFAARVELEINHYVSMVPGTEFVFNHPSRGAGLTNELVDVSDPYRPVVVGAFGDHGCHGTTFHGTFGEPGFRAYCAAIQRTEIWDLDGLDPDADGLGIRVLGVIENEGSPFTGTPAFTTHPARSLHHLATVNGDASILIVGDEWNGGHPPGACFHHDPVTGLSTPLGAVWFYDISDESAPRMLSWFTPPLVQPDPLAALGDDPFAVIPSCTSHFGEVLEGHDILVIAWYNAGVLLIDFSDPTEPVLLDQYVPEGTDVWSARTHHGYVFTSDIARGMEVLQIV